jgi:hypothetical protein
MVVLVIALVSCNTNSGIEAKVKDSSTKVENIIHPVIEESYTKYVEFIIITNGDTVWYTGNNEFYLELVKQMPQDGTESIQITKIGI